MSVNLNKLYVEQMGKCGYVFLNKPVFDNEDMDSICELVCEKYPNTEVVCFRDICVMYCNEEGRQACIHFMKKRESDLAETLEMYRRALKRMES